MNGARFWCCLGTLPTNWSHDDVAPVVPVDYAALVACLWSSSIWEFTCSIPFSLYFWIWRLVRTERRWNIFDSARPLMNTSCAIWNKKMGRISKIMVACSDWWILFIVRKLDENTWVTHIGNIISIRWMNWFIVEINSVRSRVGLYRWIEAWLVHGHMGLYSMLPVEGSSGGWSKKLYRVYVAELRKGAVDRPLLGGDWSRETKPLQTEV